MIAKLLSILALLLLAHAQNNESSMIRTFNPKWSFGPLHLTTPNGTIPFWEMEGSVRTNQDRVRLSSGLSGTHAGIRCIHSLNEPNWEVEASFLVNGNRKSAGQHKLMIRFSETVNQTKPAANEHQPRSKGLCVSFKSHGRSCEPVANVMIIQIDGESNPTRIRRNCPFWNTQHPCTLKITYLAEQLSVSFKNGNSFDQKYIVYLKKKGVQLPSEGRFSVSAQTGNFNPPLIDLVSFKTYVFLKNHTPIITDQQRKYPYRTTSLKHSSRKMLFGDFWSKDGANGVDGFVEKFEIIENDLDECLRLLGCIQKNRDRRRNLLKKISKPESLANLTSKTIDNIVNRELRDRLSLNIIKSRLAARLEEKKRNQHYQEKAYKLLLLYNTILVTEFIVFWLHSRRRRTHQTIVRC